MKYPIGIQTFANIRQEGYLYVDKTALVYQLAIAGKYYFLSRPRRFGKSLLITTLEAYFQGRRELFRGLEMERLEHDWTVYPVLHIDLNAAKYAEPEDLTAILDGHLRYFEESYGSNSAEQNVAERFKGIIRRAFEKTGKPVVILVDEYDKPLLQTIGNEELQSDYRATLKSFYGVAKSMDSCIRFALFTGVTKFSKVSIFSDLNNLEDISLSNTFAEICGMTEKEIRENMDAEIQAMAEHNGISKEECYAQLKENYDGYHFAVNSVGIYNPFSLLNALKRGEFGDYWFETGTPTFLVETLKRTNYELENLGYEEVTADLLGRLDAINTNPIPLLYQSGYLTIRGYNPRFKTYKLGFPNKEVKHGFYNFLFPYYVPIREDKTGLFVINFVKEIESGLPEKFMSRLEALFANQNYQIAGDAELYFHNAVNVIFQMLGFYVETERHTSDGSMDMVVQTKDYIYIFEFKLDQSVAKALEQIEEKQYAAPFAQDIRKLYKIGVNFSSAIRKIEAWQVVER